MFAFMWVANLYSMITYFNLPSSSAVGIIGGAEGPTAIYVASTLAPERLGFIAVAAVAVLLIIAGLVYKKARRRAK